MKNKLKKVTYFLSAITGCLLFVLILLLADSAYLYFKVPTYCYWLLLALSPLLLLPALWNRYKGNLKTKLAKHFSINLILIGCLVVASNYTRKSKGAERYGFRYFNTFTLFNFVVQTNPAQRFANWVLSFLDITAHYLVVTAEDAARVFYIKSELETDSEWKRLCPKGTRYECFLATYLDANKMAPFTYSGHVIAMSAGSYFLNKEKKEHPSTSTISIMFNLYKLAWQTKKNIEETQIKRIFPLYNFNNGSPSSTALLRVEEENTVKYFRVLEKKAGKLPIKIKKRLNSKEAKKELSEDQIKQIKEELGKMQL